MRNRFLTFGNLQRIQNGGIVSRVRSFKDHLDRNLLEFPRKNAFELAFERGEIELEVVPQGTLVERMRAAGAGIPAFYTPTGAGTDLAAGKETREFDGIECVLETALRADFALIRGAVADRLGNITYSGTSRSFNVAMAAAAEITISEVDEIVEPGEIDPERVDTPAIYVDRVVARGAQGKGSR